MTDPKPLRFLCFGMGAIGTYIGGSLALSGNEVAFIERPEGVERAKKNGLSLQLPDGKHTIQQVNVFASLGEALQHGVYDAALVAVKSFDTGSVVENIREYADRFPTLICLQNGVENETAYAAVLGNERVIGASIATAVGKEGVGAISVEKMRGIGIESGKALSAAVIAAFDRAGLNARGYANRTDLKWSKMLTNLLGNATSAILDWTPVQVFSDPQVYAIEVAQIRETLAVMQRLGIRVVNLPGTPVRPLIGLIDHFPLALSRPVSYLGLGKGRGAKMPSFHIDLYHGQTQSEVSFLNGAVVRFGTQLGIDTPVNRALTEILEGMARGTIEKSRYNYHPEAILQRIQAGI
jgi:2-dehydropantoate 2-reductase